MRKYSFRINTRKKYKTKAISSAIKIAEEKAQNERRKLSAYDCYNIFKNHGYEFNVSKESLTEHRQSLNRYNIIHNIQKMMKDAENVKNNGRYPDKFKENLKESLEQYLLAGGKEKSEGYKNGKALLKELSQEVGDNVSHISEDEESVGEVRDSQVGFDKPPKRKRKGNIREKSRRELQSEIASVTRNLHTRNKNLSRQRGDSASRSSEANNSGSESSRHESSGSESSRDGYSGDEFEEE